MGFFHPGVLEILNVDSFRLLTACGGGCILDRRTH